MELLNKDKYHLTKRSINYLYDLKIYLLDFRLQFNSNYTELFRQTYFNNDFIFIDKETKKMYKLDFNKYDVYTNNHRSSSKTQRVSTIVRNENICDLVVKKEKIQDMNRDDSDF